MKAISIFLLSSFFVLSGCSFLLEQPGDRERRVKTEEQGEQTQPGEREHGRKVAENTKPKSSAMLEKHVETFTGKVVLDDGAYRFELLKEPGTLLRLTRGRRETEFESGQILLRKYYEKTITVNGTRQDDWIWGADVTGQYVPPGGKTGPNMNAPKQTRP